jgi:putative ABC transport system permease protein
MHEWSGELRRRLQSARLDAATEADVVDELSQHLSDRYTELLSRGTAEGEARAAVLAELDVGDPPLASVIAAARGGGRAPDAIGVAERSSWFPSLVADVRYAARSLRRTPGYAAVVTLTLALGIGAAAAAHAVIDPLLLRPLGYPEPQRLVTLDIGLLGGEYAMIAEHASGFEGTASYLPGRAYGLSGDGDPERAVGARVTPGFFGTLGVAPLLGTVPVAAEIPPEGIAILSAELWQRRFGGSADIVGRAIRVDGRPVAVAGVMPPGFTFPSRTQLWIAAPADPVNVGTHWGLGGHRLIGRLRPDVEAAAAESQIRALSADLSAANPLWTPSADYRSEVRVLSLHEALVGDVRRALLLLGGAVGLLLFIACANVANLVLARGLGRARELAVRTALGASGGRIVRQLLTETLVLAAAGGATGIALSLLAVHVLRGVLPADLPRIDEIGVDVRVLAVGIAVTFVTGLLLGVLPARRATRFDLQSSLRDGGRALGDRSSRHLSGGLVVAQVALAVLLVTGAGLLVRSLLALQRVDTGMARTEVVTARVDLPEAQYGQRAQRTAFYAAFLERLNAVPGVEHVALTSQLPFSGLNSGSAMAVEHVTTDPNDLPVFIHRRVTPEFFAALGIPLRRGRLFHDGDAATGTSVAIVDETAAREFWPGEDPIGRRLGRPWMNEQLVVIGVVGAVLDGELAGAAERTVYVPLPQEPPTSAFVIIGSSTGTAVVPGLRAALRDIDPAVPLSDVGTVRSLVATTLTSQRLSTILLASFGVLALILGAVGIYGVLAYAVGQRGRELALRLALGASSGAVLRMVLGEGMRLAGVGAALGAAAALLLTRLLGGMLHDIPPNDPLTLLGVTSVVLATAAAAVLIPARRASRLAPMAALRE